MFEIKFDLARGNIVTICPFDVALQIAKPKVATSSNKWDIAVYVKTTLTLTSISRSSDKNVDVSLHYLNKQ